MVGLVALLFWYKVGITPRRAPHKYGTGSGSDRDQVAM